MAETFTLVTDGACSGNGTEAARGGWAAIITAPDGEETVLTGGEFPTTNNRMELTAALEGLAAVPDGAEVELVTDSSYIANAIGKGWLDGWSRKGWRTSGKQPVANRDLWERMIAQLARLRVRADAGARARGPRRQRAGRPPGPGGRQGRRAGPAAPAAA